MFFNLIHRVFTQYNILTYTTFRSICAFLTSFLIVFILMPKFIVFLKSRQSGGQPIRDDGPQSHLVTKAGIPTMGGVLIILAILSCCVIWGNLANKYLLLCISVMIGFGLIGALDDYKKLSEHDYHGISPRTKFLLQTVISVCCCIPIVYCNNSIDTMLYFPAFKNWIIDLGWFFIPWAVFVITGSSNAVNITDGLDGLAIGTVITTAVCFTFICYFAGHSNFANYLNITYIPGIAEICIFLSSLVGAGLGFMWYNVPPAKVFMGDTGSVSIGAVLGFISIVSKHELLYAIIGGVFVLETVSDILQIGYYKSTHKRLFKMAPIHHHFEKLGWSESTIVFRFWIISVILGVAGMSLLKIR